MYIFFQFDKRGQAVQQSRNKSNKWNLDFTVHHVTSLDTVFTRRCPVKPMSINWYQL
jgi:hypothetical protein